MTSLDSLVGCLYPEQKDEVLKGIQTLKKRYVLRSSKDVLSENDVILITYGDGIINHNESPLTTLNNFCASHLKDCISAVHLLPCFPYSSDDGFSVIDYYAINPDLGNWRNIDELSEHFDLMLDAVVNHMSKASDWFTSFLNDEIPYKDYFLRSSPHLDHSKVVRPRALPLLHEYEGKHGKVHVWTTFSEDQVDLNYKSTAVFLQVLDILLFYVSKGARFIRLDAIAFLWKEIGTECIHLPETHMVIQVYRNVLDEVAPNTVLITETNVPHEENISYFGNGHNEAHMVYNFTLPPLLALTVHQENAEVLYQWAKSLELKGNTCFFNFTASHDGVGVRPLQGIVPTKAIDDLADKALTHGGFVSYKDNGDGTQSPYELNCNYLDLLTHPKADDALRIQRFLLTQSVMLCMPGVPGVYYHSILGSKNDRQSALDSGINRRINREKLNISTLEEELETEGSFRALVFERYAEMLTIRRNEPLFNPYGPAKYYREGTVFIIERNNGNSRLYGVHNFSSKTVRLEKSKNNLEFLYPRHAKAEPWELGPFEFQWLKTQ